MQKRGKEGENGENVDLGDQKQLGGVHVVPVTEFMGEDGFDFVGFAFFDEGIKDDDVFALVGGVSDGMGMGWKKRTHGRPKK